MRFYLGQRVVCVDTKNANLGRLEELVEGHVYTIRWHGRYDDFCPWEGTDSTYCVRLEEIYRPIKSLIRPDEVYPDEVLEKCDDPPFRASRFRPLDKRKTDISIFKKLEAPTKRKLETDSPIR